MCKTTYDILAQTVLPLQPYLNTAIAKENTTRTLSKHCKNNQHITTHLCMCHLIRVILQWRIPQPPWPTRICDTHSNSNDECSTNQARNTSNESGSLHDLTKWNFPQIQASSFIRPRQFSPYVHRGRWTLKRGWRTLRIGAKTFFFKKWWKFPSNQSKKKIESHQKKCIGTTHDNPESF